MILYHLEEFPNLFQYIGNNITQFAVKYFLIYPDQYTDLIIKVSPKCLRRQYVPNVKGPTYIFSVVLIKIPWDRCGREGELPTKDSGSSSIVWNGLRKKLCGQELHFPIFTFWWSIDWILTLNVSKSVISSGSQWSGKHRRCSKLSFFGKKWEGFRGKLQRASRRW